MTESAPRFEYQPLTTRQVARGWLAAMTALADVFARLTSDPSFADAIRRDPATALRAFDLDSGELRRLELALDSSLTRNGEYRVPTD